MATAQSADTETISTPPSTQQTTIPPSADTAIVPPPGDDLSGAKMAGELDAREVLKQELDTFLEPYRNSQERPPFTTAELIVIILARNAEGIEESEMIQQTIKYFPCYLNKAVENYTKIATLRGGYFPPEVKLPMDDFLVTLNGYTVPIAVSEYMDSSSWRSKHHYQVRSTDARIFLEKYLGPPRTGVFPFLDLAPELRNRIYEYVLTVNGADGMSVSCPEKGIMKFYTSRRLNMDYRDRPRGRYNFELPLRSLKDTLALTSICKTVYVESKPLFFALNRFRFDDLTSFASTILRSPSQFGVHLSRIEISHNYGGWARGGAAAADTFHRAFAIVGQMNRLQSFYLYTSDDGWIKLNAATRLQSGIKTKSVSFKHIPALEELVKIAITAKDFKLIGQHDRRLRAYISGEVKRRKAEMAKAAKVEEAKRLKTVKVAEAAELKRIKAEKKAVTGKGSQKAANKPADAKNVPKTRSKRVAAVPEE